MKMRIAKKVYKNKERLSYRPTTLEKAMRKIMRKTRIKGGMR